MSQFLRKKKPQTHQKIATAQQQKVNNNHRVTERFLIRRRFEALFYICYLSQPDKNKANCWYPNSYYTNYINLVFDSYEKMCVRLSVQLADWLYPKP